jgi:hypothetical protein
VKGGAAVVRVVLRAADFVEGWVRVLLLVAPHPPLGQQEVEVEVQVEVGVEMEAE